MKDSVNKIVNRSDFLDFMNTYIQEFRKNGESWENHTLGDFLEGLVSWVEDMEGYYDNMDLPKPTDVNWGVFADMFMAAKMYE